MQVTYETTAGLKSHKFGLPDSKVHGANMGPIWGRQDPGWPHVGPMNFAIWAAMFHILTGHNRSEQHTWLPMINNEWQNYCLLFNQTPIFA